MQILKTRVPLGVIGIIFESRPNVTVDAATLCLKAGNVVILRGGKEAIHSNTALAEIMRDAVETAGLPKDIIQLVEDTSRETAADMMHLTGYLDVLIPRGGAGLIQAVLRQSTVPVIETGAGNCHVYVDSCLHGEADYEMAVRIIDNAKTQRPSVCNAIEGLIVHQDVAAEILPRVQAAFRTHDVTIYGDEQTRKILGDAVQPVTEELYDTEFNDYKITVKVVASLDEAMAHIAKYSTKHSECIITRDLDAAQKFQRTVDAAVVYVNASTRFTDGGEFGYGAEIGISTQKLHARGRCPHWRRLSATSRESLVRRPNLPFRKLVPLRKSKSQRLKRPLHIPNFLQTTADAKTSSSVIKETAETLCFKERCAAEMQVRMKRPCTTRLFRAPWTTP